LPKERDDRGYTSRQNPIQVAKWILSTRLEERPAGYFLDGRPAKLNLIMRETNRVRVASGMEQIDTNPAWVIND
jgi:hypothetical protein